jgi:2-oxoglutarate ferredoxin oxidoreductase subunit alpha
VDAASNVMPHEVHDVVIRLAGNSQDGIQAVGGFLARLAGRSAQEVMTFMTIPSTISGGPSIFQVRMGSGEVLSAGDEADILVAFYDHSYRDHIGALKEGGIVVYDSDHCKPNLEDRRYKHVGVPMTSLTIEAIGGTAKDKGKNLFLLGLLARIFDLDIGKLRKLLEERFKGKDESILRNALMAFDTGRAYPIGNYMELYRLHAHQTAGGRPLITIDGNQAIAYGALAAGVRYGAGYPITPWSSIMEILRAELPKYGGTFLQAEDELAAVSIACGASFAGQVALTGSSGPGIALKSEAIGWAVMAEIPLIIVDIQRGGPSTGLPTNVEQSDLHIAIYGGHGDCPRVVLAPGTVEQAFYLTVEAVRIAREYSTPVFIVSDQAIATRIEAFEEPELDKIVRDIAPDLTPRSGHKPYALDAATQHAAPGTYMQDGKYPLLTGLEHDEMGHPTGSPELHVKMTARRRDKLKALAATLPLPKVYGPAEGDVLLVCWGSTTGPAFEAVDRARAAGDAFSAIQLQYINPLPNGLEKIFEGFHHVFVVELNDEGLYGYGQLATILRARYCDPKIKGITKTDGLSFRVKGIIDRVRARIASGA